MILTPNILTIYIFNVMFVFFSTVAFIISLNIVKKYDINSSTQLQYKLQKQSYLVSTIIKFIFYVKVPLFLFFVFTLDKLSSLLNGAMCGAGVVNATVYGTPLLFLKLINLYLFAFWLVLNKEDMKYKEQPYLKLKFFIFLFFYVLLVLEIIFEFSMFFSIDIDGVVDCCGKIFSTTDLTYLSVILSTSTYILLGIFYTLFFIMLLAYFFKNRYIFALSNLFFIIISLISLISFFGTYIYELPTHHCPFCMLQSDYNYIGYFIYIFLFVGTFNGLLLPFINFNDIDEEHRYTYSLLFNSLYILIVSYFPIAYYIKNGVFLQ